MAKHSKYSELAELLNDFGLHAHLTRQGMIDLEALISAYINKEKATARMEQIDELIDLEPEKQFMHWKPQDIANFFYRVGRIRRQLEAQLASEDSNDDQ